ncbi:hypothetical protein [Dehalobacter sp. TeCB1]|uniref:hypothetical protein n=1 Tax=Dehalobacter sp. TeCB1 TaxID=1843715 RepID=UPI00083B3AF8|nr:hypothetical protein [Dehalobacter sp. TeCB1]OCZ49860.1 hypothetical protein A7D23_00485 [Dehalobacter sp. TeCB1]
MQQKKRPENLRYVLPNCYYCLKRYWLGQIYPMFCNKIRKYSKNRLDPFNLCPNTLIVWFFIPPYRAIGIAFHGLQDISVFIRQQMEPNQTIFLMFKILELRPPFPLTLLTIFVSLGLVFTDGANKIVRAVRSEYENIKPRDETVMPYPDPFSLTPRMSIYYPVLDDRTSIGFLTIDFRHFELSIKQALEPNNNIRSLIRFVDIYSPFPLQLGFMLVSIGLFLCGIIYRFCQSQKQELLEEIKGAIS